MFESVVPGDTKLGTAGGAVEIGVAVEVAALGILPVLDKPILYFAAQALSLRMFGMNEAAVRLPGMLFALLGVATTALLAARLFDRKTALVTSLALMVMPLVPAIPVRVPASFTEAGQSMLSGSSPSRRLSWLPAARS